MVGCSIRNCKSRSEKGSIIGFYSFPKKESVANEWLRYCGRKTTCKNGRVCSKHFTSSDYIKPLRHILMKESPRKVRTLKPDAIPTLQIDTVEKSYSTELTAKSTVCTGGQTDNCETKENRDISPPSCNITLKVAVHIKSESDTTPANNVEGSSNVVEESDKNITVAYIKSESDTTPANNVEGSSNVVEESDKKITVVYIKSESDTTSANNVEGSSNVVEESDKKITVVHIKSESETTPANNVEGSSNVVEERDKKITVSKAEYKLLKRKVDEYDVLKNNLKQIFTPGQIRCLTKPDRHRVKWSAEDIAAAISLISISPKGYRYLRATVGIPLPGFSTLYKWASKFGIEAGVLKNDIESNVSQTENISKQ